MCKKLVRLETFPTLINLPTVHPTRSTAEIQHSLKHLLIGMRLGHAPDRRTPKSTGDFLTKPYCPSIAAKLAAQIHIIYLRPIPIENPKISLARSPFFFVFIEQSKHKYLNLIFRLHGRPFIRLRTFNQPSVVSLCILWSSRCITGLTFRRPPRLRYCYLDSSVSKPQSIDGRPVLK